MRGRLWPLVRASGPGELKGTFERASERMALYVRSYGGEFPSAEPALTHRSSCTRVDSLGFRKRDSYAASDRTETRTPYGVEGDELRSDQD